MNDTELKYCRALQKVFKEKMGLLQYGDRYILHSKKNCHFVGSKQDIKELELYNIIRLPLPIDPVNPERGLWGMIDWKRFATRKIFEGGSIGLDSKKIEPYIEDRPTLALLKALAAQEGVTV